MYNLLSFDTYLVIYFSHSLAASLLLATVVTLNYNTHYGAPGSALLGVHLHFVIFVDVSSVASVFLQQGWFQS
jgi:hypothetical protein